MNVFLNSTGHIDNIQVKIRKHLVRRLEYLLTISNDFFNNGPTIL